MVCRHGSFAIEINDQDKEFVNEMSNELHLLKGVHQWVTTAYHPQSNGLVERQNRAIKNSFVKVWKENPLKQPSIIKGVLFAHHIVVIITAQLHSSKPELSSAQVQTLLAACRRFAMVRISGNGPGWK